MDKVLPVFASVGVGIATYQMMSGKGGNNMKSMMPIAANMMGMGTGMQGQNQQQSGNQ
ncbi:hypothetical protein [Lederbergia lenta]|uniref:hypothetical protein n=1 Tax=Lederbergia lenta TaxID=1467 RepID=UPI00203E3C14|nr:hypothetical protein [Lederbergia lenta]MCM3109389.1 hypothetical protein [Lederbergia lenta]